MGPWFFWAPHWAPQLHFPLSGAVTQDIYAAIPATAGSAAVEREVAGLASYGRQIGWLTEAVLGQQAGGPVTPAQADEARGKLVRLQADVERIKATHRERRRDEAVAALDALREHEPEALEPLLRRYQAAPPAPATRASRHRA